MFCRYNVLRFFTLTCAVLILGSCSNEMDRLEQIKAKGELVVVTRNAATTYYESSEGYVGVEYEIARAFADSLGVKARFIVKEDISDLFSAVNEGEPE